MAIQGWNTGVMPTMPADVKTPTLSASDYNNSGTAMKGNTKDFHTGLTPPLSEYTPMLVDGRDGGNNAKDFHTGLTPPLSLPDGVDDDDWMTRKGNAIIDQDVNGYRSYILSDEETMVESTSCMSSMAFTASQWRWYHGDDDESQSEQQPTLPLPHTNAVVPDISTHGSNSPSPPIPVASTIKPDAHVHPKCPPRPSTPLLAAAPNNAGQVATPASVASARTASRTTPKTHIHTAKCPPTCRCLSRCSVADCRGQVLSMSCTTGMCPTHCKLSGKCKWRSHSVVVATPPRNAAASASIESQVPASPVRPPLAKDTSIPALDQSNQPSRIVSQPASPALAAILRHSAVLQNKMDRDRLDQARMADQNKKSVTICFWNSDGPRTCMQIQGITTFPSFNIARSATSMDNSASPDVPTGTSALLRRMGLSPTDSMDVYSTAYEDWVDTPVDHVMQVTTHETILIRRQGVLRCDKLDESLRLLRSSSTSAPVLSRRVSKRRYEDSYAMGERLIKSTRLAYSPTASASASAARALASSSSGSFNSDISLDSYASSGASSLSLAADSPSNDQPAPAQEPAVDFEAIIAQTRKSLYKEHRVNTSDVVGKSWPSGVRVRDMVQSFQFDDELKDTDGMQLLSDRLAYIFNDVYLTPRNYQQQKLAWKHMTASERVDARGSSAEKDWKLWRKRTNGWAYSQKKRRINVL